MNAVCLGQDKYQFVDGSIFCGTKFANARPTTHSVLKILNIFSHRKHEKMFEKDLIKCKSCVLLTRQVNGGTEDSEIEIRKGLLYQCLRSIMIKFYVDFLNRLKEN